MTKLVLNTRSDGSCTVIFVFTTKDGEEHEYRLPLSKELWDFIDFVKKYPEFFGDWETKKPLVLTRGFFLNLLIFFSGKIYK